LIHIFDQCKKKILLILWEVFNLALEHLGYTHAATEVIGIVVDL